MEMNLTNNPSKVEEEEEEEKGGREGEANLCACFNKTPSSGICLDSIR